MVEVAALAVGEGVNDLLRGAHLRSGAGAGGAPPVDAVGSPRRPLDGEPGAIKLVRTAQVRLAFQVGPGDPQMFGTGVDGGAIGECKPVSDIGGAIVGPGNGAKATGFIEYMVTDSKFTQLAPAIGSRDHRPQV